MGSLVLVCFVSAFISEWPWLCTQNSSSSPSPGSPWLRVIYKTLLSSRSPGAATCSHPMDQAGLRTGRYRWQDPLLEGDVTTNSRTRTHLQVTDGRVESPPLPGRPLGVHPRSVASILSTLHACPPPHTHNKCKPPGITRGQH